MTADERLPLAAGAPVVARERYRYALVLYCAFLFFWNLGAAPLVDVDEGAFSEATREMLERGDFITTYLNGELRFDKPILTYWLQAIPVSLAGPVEWAFRLPSALAASLWVWLLYRFARRELPEVAALAAFMLASALGPLLIARAATADALLNAFIAGALFALYRHLAHARRADLIEAFAWTGLGILTKGPIAIVVPGVAVALYCFTRGEWRRPLALLGEWRAWLALLAIALPWYLLEWRAQGDLFIDGFFLKHNVNRFANTMLGHGGHLWYYVAALPGLAFPFIAPLVAALVTVRASWHTDVGRYAWCTFAGVFVFFSVSHTQLPHYLLYGMTPLFLLLAVASRRITRPAAMLLPSILGLALVAALPEIATRVARSATKPLVQTVLSGLPGAMHEVAWTAAVLCVALFAATFVLSRLRDRLPRDAPVWMAGAVPALFAVALFWPRAITWFQAPVVAAAEVARASNAAVVEWNANWPSFSVYRRAATPNRAPAPGEIVLTRADRADRLPPHETLFREREVLLARIVPSR